jgi:hypothetical protein
MMYAGALFYLIMVFGNLFVLIGLVLGSVFGESPSESIGSGILAICITNWVGSWLFWAGYVRLAGEQ